MSASLKLALYTTVYPGVEPYLAQWRDSVDQQTDPDFTLCIASDGLDPRSVEALSQLDREAIWVEARPNDTPLTIRSRAFALIADRFDGCIFVDADDVLLPSRVAAARSSLETADVTACGLQLIDESGQELDLRMDSLCGFSIETLLPRYNIFGLSNTTWRSDALKEVLSVPSSVMLLDWYMATLALSQGRTLAFDATCRMKYRQYGDNTAKLLPPFSPAQVALATERVADHYALVLEAIARGWDGLLALQERARTVRAFKTAIERPDLLETYTKALNQLPPTLLWWFIVTHPSLEQLWQT